MYNPNALVQTLETASMVEQNLLDSLRGPDAAHRITDEQIRNIVASVLFAPRYRDHEPWICYTGDMEEIFLFYPYDSQDKKLTVALTSQVPNLTTDGELESDTRQAWLFVSDGEHVSSRPLDYEVCTSLTHFNENEWADDIRRKVNEFKETQATGEWSKNYASAILCWAQLKGDSIAFTTEGNIDYWEPTLEHVNAILEQHYRGSVAPFSPEEYKVRISYRDNNADDDWRTESKVETYDNTREILSAQPIDPDSMYNTIDWLARTGEPYTSPLSKRLYETMCIFLVEEGAKFAEKCKNAPLLTEIQEIVNDSDHYNLFVRKAAQRFIEWESARESRLPTLAERPLPPDDTNHLYSLLTHPWVYSDRASTYLQPWKDESDFDEGTGLWDENGEPLAMHLDPNKIWDYLLEEAARYTANVYIDRRDEAIKRVRETLGAATPQFWKNKLADKTYWVSLRDALYAGVYKEQSKEMFDKMFDLSICRFLCEVEGWLQVWDEKATFDSQEKGSPFAYFSRMSQGEVLESRDADPERPVIAGEQRARLNSAHDTCRREMDELYALVMNEKYFQSKEDYRSTAPKPLDFPEVADQVKKVLDAVEALAEVANGYSPAYIQIDDEGALAKRDKENALWEQVRRTVDAVSENYPSDEIVWAKRARNAPPQSRPFRGGFGTFNDGGHLLQEIKRLVKPGWSVIFKDEVAEMVWRDVTGYLELCYLDRRDRCWGSANMVQYCGSYGKSYKKFVYSVNRAEDGSVAISYDLNRPLYVERGAPPRNYQYVSSDWMRPAARDFMEVAKEHLKKGDKEFYFVAGSDNTTRKALVDGQELVSTPLMPTDIWRYITEAEEKWLRVTPVKALPGQRGIVARAELVLQL